MWLFRLLLTVETCRCKFLKKNINNILLLRLIIAFVGIFLKLLTEVTQAGIFKFPCYNFDRPDTSLTYRACQNCQRVEIRT
jgi:hypothetical protein